MTPSPPRISATAMSLIWVAVKSFVQGCMPTSFVRGVTALKVPAPMLESARSAAAIQRAMTMVSLPLVTICNQ